MQIVTIYTKYYAILGPVHNRIHSLQQLSTPQIESCKSGAFCHAYNRLPISQVKHRVPILYILFSDLQNI